MNTDGIKRRIGRLDEPSRGLAKEVVLMKAGDDPLLHTLLGETERELMIRLLRQAAGAAVRTA
jgi:hypothetical protein